jgi:hypothetical protein
MMLSESDIAITSRWSYALTIMTFSDSFMREARQELVRLEAERTTLDKRIGALRELVGDTAPERKASAASLATAQPQGQNVADPPIAPMSFKQAVVNVIRMQPGVGVARITQALKDKGVQVGGATALSQRVYNEVYRMKKTGVIAEHQGGWVVMSNH